MSYFKINYANLIQPLEKLQILYRIQKFTANHLNIHIQSKNGDK